MKLCCAHDEVKNMRTPQLDDVSHPQQKYGPGNEGARAGLWDIATDSPEKTCQENRSRRQIIELRGGFWHAHSRYHVSVRDHFELFRMRNVFSALDPCAEADDHEKKSRAQRAGTLRGFLKGISMIANGAKLVKTPISER